MTVKPLKRMLRTLRQRVRDEPQLRDAARRADAFLVSYPKSGRTWLRFLLSCYLAELGKLGFTPDLTTTFRVLPNFDRDPVRGVGAFAAQGTGMPLIPVSHLPYRPRLFLDRPVVFLVRDPRDVMVSAYFHATRHKQTFSGTIATFLDDHEYGTPALIRFLNGWADGLANGRHLIVSYERMLAESEFVVSAILSFLDVEIRHDILGRAIAAAQFDQMRDLEREQGIPGHAYDRADPQSLRMRSGKSKAFAEWLSDEQARGVLDRCRDELTPRAQALLTVTGIDVAVPPLLATTAA